jgi:hypothetical protein
MAFIGNISKIGGAIKQIARLEILKQQYSSEIKTLGSSAATA